ncbi:MAG: hypothetical protein AAB368_06685, partial [bacterium]
RYATTLRRKSPDCVGERVRHFRCCRCRITVALEGFPAGATGEAGATGCKHDMAKCAAKGVKDCAGCEALFKTRSALEAAGAKVEVVKLKSGYAVISTGAAGTLEAIRKVNAERWTAVEGLASDGSGKKFCKDCTAFNKALRAQDVKYESVELSNGVMTVFSGGSPEAVASLKESCGVMCGLKAASAEARTEKTTASN